MNEACAPSHFPIRFLLFNLFSPQFLCVFSSMFPLAFLTVSILGLTAGVFDFASGS